MDIGELCPGLTRGDDGIWRGDSDVPISYPQRGADNLLPVEADSWWFGHRNAVLTALLESDPPELLVDIGGGNGIVSLALRDAGITTALIEPNSGGARNARERGLEHVLQATIEQCAFEPESLPAAGLFDVLEHIEDPLGFLGALRRVLRPGGRLLLTVPAYRLLWSAADVRAGHYRRYTRRGLRRELESAGFEVDFASHLFWFLPPIIAVMRALPYRLRPRATESSEGPTERDHTAGGWIFRLALRPEARRVGRQRSIPFGASIVAIAHSPAD